MQQTQSDEHLFRAYVVGGNEAAFGELAERYEEFLLGLAMGLLNRQRARAMDAVQETWMKVIKHGKTFKGDSSFKTWVYRIAVNCCRDAASRQGKSVQAPVSRDVCVPKSDERPDSSGVHCERFDELHRAINRLSAARREIVLLCYHNGMTHEQAAAILGIPVGTLKSRLHATLIELRETLSSEATVR